MSDNLSDRHLKFLLCSLFQRALDYFHLGIETPRLKDKRLLIEDIAKPIFKCGAHVVL